jgi:hypothetical protein
MFVREKKITKNGKVYGSYYQVVEGKRVDGKVKQTLVAYLGKYDSKAGAIQAAIEQGYSVSHNGKPKKTKKEPGYITKLKALDEKRRRSMKSAKNTKEYKKTRAMHDRAKKAASDAYDKFGSESAEYKAADKKRNAAQASHTAYHTLVLQPAIDLADEALAIYDGLSPREQRRVREDDIKFLENAILQRETNAAVAGRFAQSSHLF